ncbi:hypothetical protein BDZ45DRAFT_753323 [Acephala macrosclerotiorum]|nr:hypothetical protein BDZ45DRAFT_753323 [Acephala macrosclerotiorum]
MSHEYSVDAIDSRDPVLEQVMQARAQHLTVEFLQQGGVKPHVIFKLNFAAPVQVDRRLRFTGCRLSMEYLGDNGGLGGEFQIKLVGYNDATLSAHAAFQFDISQRPLQISEYIELFRGRIGNNRGDLTRFNFVQATTMSNALDGCRDFILHENRLVTWEANGVVKGNFRPGSPLSYLFHDLIGNNYETEGNLPTRIAPLPLYRGTFLDGLQRIENYQRCQLPYIPQTQAPRLAAASSGYPAGGGSYAGSSSSTSYPEYQGDYTSNQSGDNSYDAGPSSSATPCDEYQGSYGSSSGGGRIDRGESSRNGRDRHRRR